MLIKIKFKKQLLKEILNQNKNETDQLLLKRLGEKELTQPRVFKNLLNLVIFPLSKEFKKLIQKHGEQWSFDRLRYGAGSMRDLSMKLEKMEKFLSQS